MPVLRPTNIVFALMLVLLLAGCAPGTERASLKELLADAQEAAAEADPEADHDHDHDHGPDDDPDHEHPDDAVDRESVNDQEAAIDEPDAAAVGPATAPPTPDASPTAVPSTEPGGPMLEQHSDFPLDVELSLRCVERGGEMTITVDAGRENTAVGYIAIYAGEEGGGPPPYGDGHGGNSGDLTGSDGRYEDTWLVSPTAPVGPARVEVLARYRGGNSTALVRFEVVDAGSDVCDR